MACWAQKHVKKLTYYIELDRLMISTLDMNGHGLHRMPCSQCFSVCTPCWCGLYLSPCWSLTLCWFYCLPCASCAVPVSRWLCVPRVPDLFSSCFVWLVLSFVLKFFLFIPWTCPCLSFVAWFLDFGFHTLDFTWDISSLKLVFLFATYPSLCVCQF